MYLTLKSSRLSVFVLTALAFAPFAGCARLKGAVAKANANAETRLDEGVIPQDPAMEHRLWGESAIVYPSGRTVAGPTLFAVQPAPGQRGFTYTFLDSFLFFGNVATLPYTAIRGGVNGEVVSNGESVGPSFTGVGDLPSPLDARAPAPTPRIGAGATPLPVYPAPGQPGAALPGR